eukprot:280764_1
MERVYLLFMVISGMIRSAKSACGEHEEDDTWWDSSNDESFCLCQSDGTALCSQSYAEILSNSALKEELFSLVECGFYLRGEECAEDSTLWIPSDASDPSHPCPRCKCDTVDEVIYGDESGGGGNSCYEGICVDFGYVDWKMTDIRFRTDKQLETESWVCPPPTCDYNNETKYLNDAWWVDIEDDSTCQSFCTCLSDGTVPCSTTYADIVADDALIDAFNDDCGSLYESWITIYDEDYGGCVSDETDVSGWVGAANGICSCPDTVECDADTAVVHKVSYLKVFCFVMLYYFWFV